MINFENKIRYSMDDLISLMQILRSPDGCPWDREQTHKSIRRNLLEEAYEAADAIDNDNPDELLEELGDVLLQVLFHADIAKDESHFSLDDVIDATCKKLLRRHPHVFSNTNVSNGEESLSVWDSVKRKEKQHTTTADAMESVVRALPALWRAEKVQSKASKCGFDWPDYKGALDALRSEITELEEAIASGKKDMISEELGDILFSAVNVTRFFDTDPEVALNSATDKFINRFRYVESQISSRTAPAGLTPAQILSGMQPDEIDRLYRDAKDELKK